MLVMDPHKTIPLNEALPEPQPNFQLADLLESRNVDWSWINKTLKSAPAVFEELLFRVHFKRNKRLPRGVGFANPALPLYGLSLHR